MTLERSKLIAHRGDMRRYPENTLLALQAAVEAGACHIEFDVQLSRDRVPVLFHDLTLLRTTARLGTVKDYGAEQLRTFRADGAPHLGKQFPEATIPTLSQAIELLNSTPKVNVFVELKRHSLEHFGIACCVDTVLDTMASAHFPWVFVSFIKDALRYVQARYPSPVGWILREHSDAYRDLAHAFRPQYLFCNIKRLPKHKDTFWPGPWRWAVYDIAAQDKARAWLARGADMIETCCITRMLNASP